MSAVAWWRFTLCSLSLLAILVVGCRAREGLRTIPAPPPKIEHGMRFKGSLRTVAGESAPLEAVITASARCITVVSGALCGITWYWNPVPTAVGAYRHITLPRVRYSRSYDEYRWQMRGRLGVAASAAELFAALDQQRADARGEVEFDRASGEPVDVNVANAWSFSRCFRESPCEPSAAAARSSSAIVGAAPAQLPRTGLTLLDHARGVAIVTAVSPGSSAATAGVQVGDLVIGMNELPVPNVQMLSQLIAGSPGTFLLYRGDLQLVADGAHEYAEAWLCGRLEFMGVPDFKSRGRFFCVTLP